MKAFVLIGLFFSMFNLSALSPDILKQLEKLNKTSSKFEQKCTNFSGSWKGECITATRKVEENQFMHIRQYDCDWFNNGWSFSLNGRDFFTKISRRGDSTQAACNMNWNESFTELTLNCDTTYRDAKGEKGFVDRITSKDSYFIQNDKLHLKSKFHVFLNGREGYESSKTCTYSKIDL